MLIPQIIGKVNALSLVYTMCLFWLVWVALGYGVNALDLGYTMCSFWLLWVDFGIEVRSRVILSFITLHM